MYSPKLEPLQAWTPETLANRLCLSSRKVGQDLNLASLPHTLISNALEIIASRNALSDNILTLCISSETAKLRLIGAYHL